MGSFKWSPDGQSIAFTALDPLTSEEEKATKEKNDARVVDENIKMSRLYVISSRPTNGPPAEARLLTKGNYSVGNEGGRTGRAFDWSPDGKALVFSRTSTPRPDDWMSADLMLVDVATGTVKPLVQTRAAETLPCFSPDGRWIAYVASDNPPTWGGSGVIHVIPANGGVPRSLTETFDRFGRYSDLIGWSADGSKLYYAEARGTTLQVGALPLDAKPQQISQADGMMVGGVHLNHSRTKLGFAWEGLTRPAEAYVSAVERFEPVQVSRENQDVAVPPLGRTEVVRWKSADGLEIEGLLTYPVGYEKGKRYPLLLVIHGGPMGVFSQNYIGALGPLPHRSVRLARLRRPPLQHSRQQRLRAEVSLRQLRRLGGRRLQGLDDRSRSRRRRGGRRSGAVRRHGLELRRLHDFLGHHPDQALPGCVGGGRGYQPHELHRHRRHPQASCPTISAASPGTSSTPTAPTPPCSTSRA